MSSNPNLILGSDSADCPTVLFADTQKQIIGLCHAGWKGAKKGVLEETIQKMQQLGSHPHHIVAAVSPCIAQESYEVSLEFYHDFLSDTPDNAQFFLPAPKSGHFLFDLPGYVKCRLLKLNLKEVSLETAFNTYTDEERFFSCRRARHKNEPYFGGHISCITLKDIS